MLNYPKKLIILIPSTFTSNVKNRMLRTFVIGKLARFLAIGRVTHVYVYYDEDPFFDSHALGKYIVKVLKYSVTPPWLKKLAFPFSHENKYLGVVPPLQINSHLFDKGPIVWGVIQRIERKYGVLKVRVNFNWMEIKVKISEIMKSGYSPKVPQIVLFDINANRIVPFKMLNRDQYVGFYPVYSNKNVHKTIEEIKKLFDVIVIGTSKYGIYYEDVLNKVLDFSKDAVCLVFGGPNRGLFKIKGFIESDCVAIINLMKKQETKTLRVEEAILLALSKLKLC